MQVSYNVHCSDTFNENSPPTNDPDFISSLGSAVYKAMSKADKDAVWLMQVGSYVLLIIFVTIMMLLLRWLRKCILFPPILCIHWLNLLS